MAAPPGAVDTLNMLFEKLEGLFNDSQGYYESFLDTNNRYKKGEISEKEFFKQLGDYVVAYSALEFLAVKVLFEIKKALDKQSGGKASGATQSPGLMPGVGAGGAGMMGGGGMTPPQEVKAGTKENPVGRPPSIVSSEQGYDETMPAPEPQTAASMQSGTDVKTCPSCGVQVRSNAKFCTKCGNKLN